MAKNGTDVDESTRRNKSILDGLSTRWKVVIVALMVLAALIFLFGLGATLYLLHAAIFPNRFPLTDPVGVTELSAVAAATPAASLALLTIALVFANFYLARIAGQDLELTTLAVKVATDEANASQTLARQTVEDRAAQWEPFVNARIKQQRGSIPDCVDLTNLGKGPAIDCIYVIALKDDRLEVWYATKPVDILPGERLSIPLGDVLGFDRMEYVTSDTSTVDAQLRPLKRRVRRYKMPFDKDTLFLQAESISPPTHIGSSPTPGIFKHLPDGTQEFVQDRQEAVICMCANGHVHRTLPHLRKAEEQFDPSDTNILWLSWYTTEARYGVAAPAEIQSQFNPPPPAVIDSTLLSEEHP